MDGNKLKEQVKKIENKECHCTHNCAMITSVLYNPSKWPNIVYQTGLEKVLVCVLYHNINIDLLNLIKKIGKTKIHQY